MSPGSSKFVLHPQFDLESTAATDLSTSGASLGAHPLSKADLRVAPPASAGSSVVPSAASATHQSPIDLLRLLCALPVDCDQSIFDFVDLASANHLAQSCRETFELTNNNHVLYQRIAQAVAEGRRLLAADADSNHYNTDQKLILENIGAIFANDSFKKYGVTLYQIQFIAQTFPDHQDILLDRFLGNQGEAFTRLIPNAKSFAKLAQVAPKHTARLFQHLLANNQAEFNRLMLTFEGPVMLAQALPSEQEFIETETLQLIENTDFFEEHISLKTKDPSLFWMATQNIYHFCTTFPNLKVTIWERLDLFTNHAEECKRLVRDGYSLSDLARAFPEHAEDLWNQAVALSSDHVAFSHLAINTSNLAALAKAFPQHATALWNYAFVTGPRVNHPQVLTEEIHQWVQHQGASFVELLEAFPSYAAELEHYLFDENQGAHFTKLFTHLDSLSKLVNAAPHLKPRIIAALFAENGKHLQTLTPQNHFSTLQQILDLFSDQKNLISAQLAANQGAIMKALIMPAMHAANIHVGNLQNLLILAEAFPEHCELLLNFLLNENEGQNFSTIIVDAASLGLLLPLFQAERYQHKIVSYLLADNGVHFQWLFHTSGEMQHLRMLSFPQQSRIVRYLMTNQSQEYNRLVRYGMDLAHLANAFPHFREIFWSQSGVLKSQTAFHKWMHSEDVDPVFHLAALVRAFPAHRRELWVATDLLGEGHKIFIHEGNHLACLVDLYPEHRQELLHRFLVDSDAELKRIVPGKVRGAPNIPASIQFAPSLEGVVRAFGKDRKILFNHLLAHHGRGLKRYFTSEDDVNILANLFPGYRQVIEEQWQQHQSPTPSPLV